MARGTADNQGNVQQVDIKGAGSYLATGDYYFTSNMVRPFAGVGAGLFSLASASLDPNTNGGVSGAKSKFGGMVRAGAEIGHFRVGVEYNLVGNTDIKTLTTPLSVLLKTAISVLRSGLLSAVEELVTNSPVN